MGKLINIDNGGTLTDFCALDGERIHHTKSITTPHDLSKCFFDGLRKLARAIYGDELRIGELLQTTDYIRYSTTQGTNALVERKGPRLGLLVQRGADLDGLCSEPASRSLFADLVGTRVALLDVPLGDDHAAADIVRAVNEVAGAGANRIVLSIDAAGFRQHEARIQRVIGRKFPSHLLGVVPVLAASELADDDDFGRRTWTALANAFLHPAMERFLYSADHRLKSHRTRHPLLIFRNDGGASRVAKTMALKTYSSGPRGGLEGVRALAAHYGFQHVLSCDVGGTTTDVGCLAEGGLETRRHGVAEGVELSLPLARIHSVGVGGSSVIRVRDGSLSVGPESVGAAPGPACFGLGGRKATITDVVLLLGLLDPATYFAGELELDPGRAREAVRHNVAEPLGVDLPGALRRMLDAWVGKIAHNLGHFGAVRDDTTLALFGGAGPLLATRIADAVGSRRVVIPRMSAVFSAFGIGFSPLSQEYRVQLTQGSDDALHRGLRELRERARRDMFAEGVDLADCQISATLVRDRAGDEEAFPLDDEQRLPCELAEGDRAFLQFGARRSIGRMHFHTNGARERHPAQPQGLRTLQLDTEQRVELPVYRLEELLAGACARGPAVVEEAYFTGLVDEGWDLSITGPRDLLLERTS